MRAKFVPISRSALRPALVSALLASIAWLSVHAQSPTVFDNTNVYAVNNGAPAGTVFTLNGAAVISQIQTYHWNYGRGAAPGYFVLRNNATAMAYGPFQAVATPGHNNAQNVNWIANVALTLAPGSYTLYDSQPATWSQNPQSSGFGFVRLLGAYSNVPAPPPPPPMPRPNPLPPIGPFGAPSIDNYRLGQCYKGTGQYPSGTDCGGQTAANAFCRTKGYSSALSFKTMAVTMPTKAIGDGAICTVPPSQSSYLRCYTFDYINCKL